MEAVEGASFVFVRQKNACLELRKPFIIACSSSLQRMASCAVCTLCRIEELRLGRPSHSRHSACILHCLVIMTG
jgi:hypothetical protein